MLAVRSVQCTLCTFHCAVLSVEGVRCVSVTGGRAGGARQPGGQGPQEPQGLQC